MTGQEVLSKVLDAGGRVIPDRAGPQLAFPRSLRPLVEAHRRELRRFLIEEWSPRPLALAVPAPEPGPAQVPLELLAMPLEMFGRSGQLIEVRVAWWSETLWFVPTLRDAEALWREGVARERVWTAPELRSILEDSQWTSAALRVVMVARREFGGEVVEVRARG